MTKTFARIPANAPVMVDANIVVYALFPTASHHESCKNLLERGAQDEIQLQLTVHTAADIIHRAMILEKIQYLATNDSDFERLPGIAVRKPG
jgi:predicted nucleic acid-binding protein